MCSLCTAVHVRDRKYTVYNALDLIAKYTTRTVLVQIRVRVLFCPVFQREKALYSTGSPLFLPTLAASPQ